MTLINLQKFPLTIFKDDGSQITFDGSAVWPKLDQRYKRLNDVDDCSVYRLDTSIVLNMPNAVDGTSYIVTTVIAASLCTMRNDLLTPYNAVRNGVGQIIGFRGFKQW